jgi:hypothetical protein
MALGDDQFLHSDAECTGCAVPDSRLCETVSVLLNAHITEQQQLLYLRSTRTTVYTAAICGGTGGTVLCADRALVR